MPVPATGFPDVLVGHPDPPVTVGLGDHRLDQAAILLLDLAAATELRPCLVQPCGERVAHPLQVGYPEHPRPADSADRPLDPLAREGGREKLAELLLQQGDLPAEVLTGRALGERVDLSRANAECHLQGIHWLKRRIARLGLQHLLGHEGLRSPESTSHPLYPCGGQPYTSIATSVRRLRTKLLLTWI